VRIQSTTGNNAVVSSPWVLSRYWIDQKIRGQAAEPKSASSVLHLQRVIARNPDAIGYVRANQLTPSVKTITVDGIAFIEANYPLQVIDR